MTASFRRLTKHLKVTLTQPHRYSAQVFCAGNTVLYFPAQEEGRAWLRFNSPDAAHVPLSQEEARLLEAYTEIVEPDKEDAQAFPFLNLANHPEALCAA